MYELKCRAHSTEFVSPAADGRATPMAVVPSFSLREPSACSAYGRGRKPGRDWFTHARPSRKVNLHGHVLQQRLSDWAVAEVVKRSLKAAGRVRVGAPGEAHHAGERSNHDQSGHRSLVDLRRSIRDGSLFRANAVAKVGLLSKKAEQHLTLSVIRGTRPFPTSPRVHKSPR
jgi:hypothetical protein